VNVFGASRGSCPSDLRLDQLHSGELDPKVVPEVRTHADGCERCKKRLAAREAGFGAFSTIDARTFGGSVHDALLARGPRRPPWYARRAVYIPAAVVAAGVIVLTLLKTLGCAAP
jgi:hypothetical protein